MTNKSGANSTGGASGPRDDESKRTNTSDTGQAARSAFFDTIDDDSDVPGIDDNPKVAGGTKPVNEQAQSRSPGPGSIHDTDFRIHSDPHDEEEYHAIHDDDVLPDYEEARNLVAPDPRPGMAQAWINWFERDGTLHRGLQNSLKRGWTPRNPSTLSAKDARFYQTKRMDGTDVILSPGGMVLCEMSKSRMDSIQRAEEEKHKRNSAATMNEVRTANDAARRMGYSRQIQVEIDSSDTVGRR